VVALLLGAAAAVAIAWSLGLFRYGAGRRTSGLGLAEVRSVVIPERWRDAQRGVELAL
jgi:hypothetical protein